MSRPPPNTHLSRSARWLSYLGPPSTVLLTAYASPKTSLFSPLAFLPSAYFLRRWRRANARAPSRRGELEPLLWVYACTGTLGLAAAAVLQMGMCYAVTVALFGRTGTRREFLGEFQRATVEGLGPGELQRRWGFARSGRNWVFNGVLGFLMAGLVEETLKYLPVLYASRRGTSEGRKTRDRAYLDYALAGALSFGVIENIGFLYVACGSGGESWSRLALTLVERIVVGASGHLLCAALTGLRAIRRDYYGEKWTWWRVVGPAVVLHGIFDFVALSASALDGNVGWIHPRGWGVTAGMVAGCSVAVGAAAVWVRREWRWLAEADKEGSEK